MNNGFEGPEERRVTVLPDFLGIGAQKAGTTWLYRNLRNHPEIWMPRKELHYFDRKLGRGTEWYAAQFAPGEGCLTGEITPAYSTLSAEEISHVHSLLPGVKLIFLMRNPIERAWSQALMRFENQGREPSEEELLEFLELSSRRRLSNYLLTLDNWERFYPATQIFVGFLEDVSFSPGLLLPRLYEFLGVGSATVTLSAQERIHSRSTGAMPAKMAVRLALFYQESLRRLEERFGGYASFWRYCAERLVEDAPSDSFVPYPFWESQMWDDWISSLEGSPEAYTGELQSNLLSLAAR